MSGEIIWFAVRVIAGQRVRVGDDVDAPFLIERALQQRGFDTIAPRKTVYRYGNGVAARKRMKTEVPRAILPGWVFVGWPAGENMWRQLSECPGVIAVAKVDGRPAPISDSAVRSFAAQFGSGLVTAHERERYMRSRGEYAPGDTVRVVAGTFDGLEGQVVSVSRREAKILLPLFNSAREISIDAAMLELKAA